MTNSPLNPTGVFRIREVGSELIVRNEIPSHREACSFRARMERKACLAGEPTYFVIEEVWA